MRGLVQAQTYLTPDEMGRLNEEARRLGCSRSELIRSLILGHYGPGGVESPEGVVVRGLERVHQRLNALAGDVAAVRELLVLFIQTWLTAEPPMDPATRAEAEARGVRRFQDFLAAVEEVLAGGGSEASRLSEAGPN